MFDLNPFQNSDAIWQHSLMVLVSFGLGYMIGVTSENAKLRALKIRLAKLDRDLESCQNKQLGAKE